MRHLNTGGRFRLDDIVGVVTRREPLDLDHEQQRRFAHSLELLRSLGLEFHPAYPEGQKPPRRKWWRTTTNRGGSQ